MLTALALLAIRVQTESYELKLDLKPGASFTFDMVRQFNDPQDEFEMSFLDSITFKVIEVNEGKTTLGIIRKLRKQTMDGQELPLDPKAEPLILRDIRQANGALTWTKPALVDAEAEARLWRLMSVPLPDQPVRVGQRWSVDYPDLTELKLPSARSQYALESVDSKRKTATIRIDYRELSTKDPISALGSATIGLEDGWPSAISLDVRNARIPGGEGKPMKLKLKLTAIP